MQDAISLLPPGAEAIVARVTDTRIHEQAMARRQMLMMPIAHAALDRTAQVGDGGD